MENEREDDLGTAGPGRWGGFSGELQPEHKRVPAAPRGRAQRFCRGTAGAPALGEEPGM